jgi:SAM-dependent methyltransferase
MGTLPAAVGEGAPTCCAHFYEQEWVQRLLGDSFHPGGLALTGRLAAGLQLPAGARVLDVACGIGTTALALAGDHGWEVVGLDPSTANLDKARQRGAAAPDSRLAFVAGTADALPFAAESFDAVVCECALSTFADQPRAVAEMARVVRAGGVVGISDMVVEGILPEEMRGPLAAWACVAGARSVREYQRLFLEQGLATVGWADESAELLAMLGSLKRKLLGIGLFQLAGQAIGLDLSAALSLLQQARALVDAGTVQYCRLVFGKGRPRYTRMEDRRAAVPSVACCDPATGCC